MWPPLAVSKNTRTACRWIASSAHSLNIEWSSLRQWCSPRREILGHRVERTHNLSLVSWTNPIQWCHFSSVLCCVKSVDITRLFSATAGNMSFWESQNQYAYVSRNRCGTSHPHGFNQVNTWHSSYAHWIALPTPYITLSSCVLNSVQVHYSLSYLVCAFVTCKNFQCQCHSMLYTHRYVVRQHHRSLSLYTHSHIGRAWFI